MINTAQRIYQNLQDDVSRTIFISRLEYNITGDFKKLKPAYDCIGITQRILDILKWKKSVVIFGAGAYGQRLLTLYPEIKWEAFCDNDNQLWGGESLGLPIISLKELKESYKESVIVISPCYSWELIEEQLRSEKIKNEYVILRKIIDDAVGVQYFSCPFIKPIGEEIFVDAGVLDGLSTIDFKLWAGKNYKCSYLFEPQKDVISDIESNLKNIDYNLIDKGLWNKKTDLYFRAGTEDNPGGFALTEIENTGEKISVTTLDDEMMDVPVTFIKMDIEGSEYKALLGGEEVIRRYEPRLAICVYHKPEDIIEIPKLIMELNPKYRLYLRHYSFSWTETVMYAISK